MKTTNNFQPSVQTRNIISVSVFHSPKRIAGYVFFGFNYMAKSHNRHINKTDYCILKQRKKILNRVRGKAGISLTILLQKKKKMDEAMNGQTI